jgi:5-formyltetrahydrofolate cyclo-ligase
VDEAEIRRKTREKRKSLATHEVAALTKSAFARLQKLLPDSWWKAKRVALYRALPGEPDLQPFEAWLAEKGTILHFPRVTDRSERQIEMVEVSHASGGEWVTGPYGIQEPPLEAKASDASSLDLIFVPGAAFGKHGERIGMGKGYYDRYLERAERALFVAIAFDFQVYPSLEQKPWDRPVHWIVTESREIMLKGME